MEDRLNTNLKFALLICCLSSLMCSCRTLSSTNESESLDFQHEAINVAINDWLQTRIAQQDSIIGAHLMFYDTADIFIVSFFVLPRHRNYNKYFPESVDYALENPTAPRRLPSEYVIKNNKIFYWRNPNVPFSKKMAALLYQYNQVFLPNEDGWMITGRSRIPNADYYFCKNNYKKYKRRYSWYSPLFKIPKMNCCK